MRPELEESNHTQRATPRETTSLTDESIVERVKAGDLVAFELLMRRYNQRLFRIARSILGDDHEAEDVVQDTYLRTYTQLHQFAGRSAFSTWLTKIAVHEAVARRKRQQRQRACDLSKLESVPMTEDDFSVNSVARHATNSELADVLAEAVDELPSELRLVFTLRLVEGLDTLQTSECLGLTQANVKVRLHRARSLLQKTIDDKIGRDIRQLYQFDGERCDRIVTNVLTRLQSFRQETFYS